VCYSEGVGKRGVRSLEVVLGNISGNDRREVASGVMGAPRYGWYPAFMKYKYL